MLANIRKSYHHTIYASYLGYITQAIVNNFAPLLFLTFMAEFDLTLERITLITTVNFLVQLAVDAISAKVVDQIGYRPCIMAAHFCSAVGLIGLAVLPSVMSPMAGIMTAVVLYAIGGGIIEVLISPIVEACPTDEVSPSGLTIESDCPQSPSVAPTRPRRHVRVGTIKESAMSLLHSFYCWGHAGLVLLSTAFFAVFGMENWRVLACIWALVPLINIAYFALVPIYPIVADKQQQMSIRDLFRRPVFWLLMAMMVCAGASEQGMSQWASAFAEKGLGISKAIGDLLGPCAFAVTMGTARALYGKFAERLPLRAFMAMSSALCIVCYLAASLCASPVLGLIGCALCGFSVGIFWPGTFSIAAKLLPGGGTAMYALMALGGDLGCSGGPTTVGLMSGLMGGNMHLGLLTAIVFPIGMLVMTLCQGRKGKSAE